MEEEELSRLEGVIPDSHRCPWQALEQTCRAALNSKAELQSSWIKIKNLPLLFIHKPTVVLPHYFQCLPKDFHMRKERRE